MWCDWRRNKQAADVPDIYQQEKRTTEKVGVIGGYLDAGNAIYEAVQHPTAGNITKAALKTVMAVVKTNPVVNLISAAADLTGLTYWLFNW